MQKGSKVVKEYIFIFFLKEIRENLVDFLMKTLRLKYFLGRAPFGENFPNVTTNQLQLLVEDYQ